MLDFLRFSNETNKTVIQLFILKKNPEMCIINDLICFIFNNNGVEITLLLLMLGDNLKEKAT